MQFLSSTNEHISSSSVEVSPSDSELYQNVLTFNAAWHLVFSSFWKDFRARFEGILNTIEKHRDFINKEASSIDMVEDRAARTRILDDIAERQRQMAVLLDLTDAQIKQLQLQSSKWWLAVDHQKQEIERDRRSTMKHAGTLEWIGQVPEMKSWLEDDVSEPICGWTGNQELVCPEVLIFQYLLTLLKAKVSCVPLSSTSLKTSNR